MARAKTEYMCLNGTPLGSVHMQSAQLPQLGYRFQISGKHPAEPDIYGDMSTGVNNIEDTVWMKQLENDVWRPMRYESTTVS